MPTALSSSNRSASLLVVLFVSAVPYVAWAEVAPACPAFLDVTDGVIAAPSGWSVYHAAKFRKVRSYMFKDGRRIAEGKAPAIGGINDFATQREGTTAVGLIEPEDMPSAQGREQYRWPLDDRKTAYQFLCDYGNEEIKLFRPVPKNASECIVTYVLVKGKRSQERQETTCR